MCIHIYIYIYICKTGHPGSAPRCTFCALVLSPNKMQYYVSCPDLEGGIVLLFGLSRVFGIECGKRETPLENQKHKASLCELSCLGGRWAQVFLLVCVCFGFLGFCILFGQV